MQTSFYLTGSRDNLIPLNPITMEIKHILVPVDFSPCSNNALRLAADLAKKWDSKVFALHATVIPEAYMTVAGTYTPIDMGPLHQEVSQSFELMKKEIPALGEISYEPIETNLNLVDGLDDAIHSRQIDLIIMGTRNEHDRLERILGTHASEVIESAHVPVLMIPGGTEAFHPLKIGFATDAKSITHVSRLGYIAELAAYFNATIDIFFVAKPNESMDFDLSSSKKVLERYFQNLDYKFHNLQNEHLRHGIQSFLDENGIDLLAMIPRHHSALYRLLHGSTTKYMAQHIAIPLLALPE